MLNIRRVTLDTCTGGLMICGIIQWCLWVEISLTPPTPKLPTPPQFTPAGSELRSQMTAVARRSYFTFSLAVKEDEVITVLEWQLGSEVKQGSSK